MIFVNFSILIVTTLTIVTLDNFVNNGNNRLNNYTLASVNKQIESKQIKKMRKRQKVRSVKINHRINVVKENWSIDVTC